MNFKDLFIVPDENDKKVQEVKSTVSNNFPTQVNTVNQFPSGSIPQPPIYTPSNVNNDHLTTLMDKYNTSFEGLNQPGYDFYEFFQAIVTSNGIDNPQFYTMAMSMAKSMDKTLTKDKLVTSSDYYIDGLTKFYNTVVDNGNGKKQTLITQKESETQSLTSDLNDLRAQLDRITSDINNKQNLLNTIDSKYQPDINEIESKLRANDYAKSVILTNIQKVKTGVINNIIN